MAILSIVAVLILVACVVARGGGALDGQRHLSYEAELRQYEDAARKTQEIPQRRPADEAAAFARTMREPEERSEWALPLINLAVRASAR